MSETLKHFADGARLIHQISLLNPEARSDIAELGNIVYQAVSCIELEGEYGKQPIDPEKLAHTVKSELEETLRSPHTLRFLSRKLEDSFIQAAGKLAADLAKDRVKDGIFYGNGHHVRQDVTAQIQYHTAKAWGLQIPPMT